MRLLAALAALAIAACAGEPEPPSRDTLTLSPLGDGTWRADYSFAEPRTEWVFARSRGDYRTDMWEAVSDGAEVVREDGFDRIQLDTPATMASFRFTPFPGPLDRTYDPALEFGDGSAALFMDQFSVLPLDVLGPNELTADTANPGDMDGGRACTAVGIESESRMIVRGEVVAGPQSFDVACDDGPPLGYVYVGDLPLVEGEGVVAVTDPDLPEWRAESVDRNLVLAFDKLGEAFGERMDTKPTVYVSHLGGGFEGVSLSGSVLQDTIVFLFGGAQLEASNPAIPRYLGWLFTHEGAHLFQRRNGQMPWREQWIPEGHASAMAFRVYAERDPALAEWVAGRVAEEDGICAGAGGTFREALSAHPYECGQLVWRSLSPDLAGDWNRMVAGADVSAPLDAEAVMAVLPSEAADRMRAALSAPAAEAVAALSP